VNTLHHLFEDSRINIARHEFAHAFLAHELGFFVERITLEDHADRHAGCTEITYPLDCANFGEVYERSPLQAAAWTVQILGVIRSGGYCEIRGGQIGWDPKGGDLDHIQAWCEALLPIYGNDGWIKLYAASFLGIRNWYASPNVREVFRVVSVAIAHRTHISRYQFLDALAQADINTCPPPHFVPVLPPARRQPAPAQAPAFSPSVRPRVEAQGVPPTPAPTLLHLPHPIPVSDTDDFLVFYLRDHAGASLIRIAHRRTRAQAWAVIAPRGSWEFADHAKALAKFQSLDPKARMVSR